MSRPPKIPALIITHLAQHQKQYTPGALAYVLGLKVGGVQSAIESLLITGSLHMKQINQKGFAYRHPETPDTASIVEIKMVRAFTENGKPMEFMRNISTA